MSHQACWRVVVVVRAGGGGGAVGQLGCKPWAQPHWKFRSQYRAWRGSFQKLLVNTPACFLKFKSSDNSCHNSSQRSVEMFFTIVVFQHIIWCYSSHWSGMCMVYISTIVISMPQLNKNYNLNKAPTFEFIFISQ